MKPLGEMILSVVIPTYNRGPKLGATLDAVLACETTGLETVEVIVVDDGSPTPAEPVVAGRVVPASFHLRCIRQDNAGPAKARNTGFRASQGDIVLFMDDDILPTPTLLREHVAAHQERPGSVIFGRCPYAENQPRSKLLRYLIESMDVRPAVHQENKFTTADLVASGQLSVRRSMFPAANGVYRDDLITPAAEEVELTYQLVKRGIPILFAPGMLAVHHHPVELEGICRMYYKRAVGCGEVVMKSPATLTLPVLRDMVNLNGPVQRNDTFSQRLSKFGKAFLSFQPVRKTLIHTTLFLERWNAPWLVLKPLYALNIRSHYWAGLRDGLSHKTFQR